MSLPLSLPPLDELTPEQRELLATTDREIKTLWIEREIKEYQEELHPRDDHGRWTSDGGGGELPDTANVGKAFDAMEADRFDQQWQQDKHPENYEQNRGYGVHLRLGATEWRRGVSEDGVPTVYQVHGVPGSEWRDNPDLREPGTMPMTAPDGASVGVLRVEGSEKPDPYVYRVMSTGEFDQANERGFLQSNQSMNLADEGTVASRGSTGSFYAPIGGEDYRVVQIDMHPEDGWRVGSDGYVKTPDPVPISRVASYSQVIPGEPDINYRVASPKSLKYSEDQERDDHGRWTDGGTAEPVDLQTAIDEAMSPTEVADVIKNSGFEEIKFDQGSPVWVSPDGQQVITWDGVSSYAEIADVDRWLYDADVSEYYPDYDQQWNKEFWDRPETLYHATDEGNIPAILSEGLEMRSDTRGLTNRYEGAAVYTSTDPEEVAYYYGSVLEIDTAAMKADGLTPFVNQEPDVEEGNLREALAAHIGYDSFEYEYSTDTSPSTVVVNGPIPPQYIHLVDQAKAAARYRMKYSEDQARDDHGRWTSDGGAGAYAVGTAPLSPADKPGSEDQALLELLDAKMVGLTQNRPDVDAYAEATGQDPGEEELAAVFAKNDNVREIGNELIDQAKTDPELQAWLSNPGHQLDFMDPDSPGGPYTEPDQRSWAMTVNGELWGQDPVAGEFGIPMPEDLAEANAYYMAAVLQDSWAASASDSNIDSLSLQERANELFHLGLRTDDIYLHSAEKETYSRVLEFATSAQPVLDAYLRTEYVRTQAMFKEAGITEVTLFRGVRFDESNPPPEDLFIRPDDHESQMSLASGPHAVETNPMASWSASSGVARVFAGPNPPSTDHPAGGVVLSATVPVSRIISSPYTGQGCLNEMEFVVLGGNDSVWVDHPSYQFEISGNP